MKTANRARKIPKWGNCFCTYNGHHSHHPKAITRNKFADLTIEPRVDVASKISVPISQTLFAAQENLSSWRHRRLLPGDRVGDAQLAEAAFGATVDLVRMTGRTNGPDVDPILQRSEIQLTNAHYCYSR